MRTEKKIDLKGYTVTLKELRIGDVRNFLVAIKDSEIFKDGSFDNTSLLELITDHYSAIEPLVSECLVFSDSEMSVDDVPLSDSLKIAESFMEVNPVFLSFVAQAQKDERATGGAEASS